jgi:hypothetical protein
MSTIKYWYTVPTDDKTISSVKGSVLAVGVALFFLYLVRNIFYEGQLWISNFSDLCFGQR